MTKSVDVSCIQIKMNHFGQWKISASTRHTISTPFWKLELVSEVTVVLLSQNPCNFTKAVDSIVSNIACKKIMLELMQLVINWNLTDCLQLNTSSLWAGISCSVSSLLSPHFVWKKSHLFATHPWFSQCREEVLLVKPCYQQLYEI